MSSPDPHLAADPRAASRNRLVLVVYTSAIFVSALLLFSVQPLFTKMVLPRLGGSPAVWSVAMVFFQSLLLAGYAYAHYLMRVKSRTIPVLVHLVLLVIALATLPAKTHVSDDTGSAESVDLSPAPTSTKPSSKTSAAGNTPVDETQPSEAPLVVKGGKSPTTHAKPGAADTPAPSMIGIATAGASAPPPDLGSSAEVAPRPLLQTLNISQGVSRGLLYKKVQPVYPRNALSMHLEGTVELMATISKTGDITHVKVLSGDSQLAKAATDAVRQWKYKSYLLNGEPVEIQTQVTIKFNLPK